MSVYSDLVTGSADKEVKEILENPFLNFPTIEKALDLSKKYDIALHPKYLFYWNELSSNDLISFLENLSRIEIESDKSVIKSSQVIHFGNS